MKNFEDFLNKEFEEKLHVQGLSGGVDVNDVAIRGQKELIESIVKFVEENQSKRLAMFESGELTRQWVDGKMRDFISQGDDD